MPTPRRRPFTVLDGMILVAATAVGCWLLPHVWGPLSGPELWEFGESILEVRTFEEIHLLLTNLTLLVMPVLLPWTMAVLWIGLRRPRPTLRRLSRQPGFAACLAVAVATAFTALGPLASEARRLMLGSYARPEFVDFFLTAPFGFAVAGAWVVMACGRSFHCNTGWIDRTGRVIGVYWVVELILILTKVDSP